MKVPDRMLHVFLGSSCALLGNGPEQQVLEVEAEIDFR
jgi:hypothetical protein